MAAQDQKKFRCENLYTQNILKNSLKLYYSICIILELPLTHSVETAWRM